MIGGPGSKGAGSIQASGATGKPRLAVRGEAVRLLHQIVPRVFRHARPCSAEHEYRLGTTSQ